MTDNQSQQKTRPYVCSYFHDRAEWSLTIHAYDWSDAKARCLKLGVTLDGELVATVPLRVGFLAKFVCAFRNLLHLVFGSNQPSEALQSSKRDR